MDIEELIRVLLIGFVYLMLAIVPLAIVACGWLWLSSTLNREERARCFLSLLELSLQQGHTPEQTIRSLADARVGLEEMGRHFPTLAEAVQSGTRLSAALQAVPKFLPRQVRAMLRVGEELGELRKVLPACRATLTGARGQTQSISNNLVVLMFVSPVGPLVLAVLAVWIFPKLKEIARDMVPDTSAWSGALFDGSTTVAWIIAATVVLPSNSAPDHAEVSGTMSRAISLSFGNIHTASTASTSGPTGETNISTTRLFEMLWVWPRAPVSVARQAGSTLRNSPSSSPTRSIARTCRGRNFGTAWSAALNRVPLCTASASVGKCRPISSRPTRASASERIVCSGVCPC